MDGNSDWMRIRDRNWQPTGPSRPAANGCGGSWAPKVTRGSWKAIPAARTTTRWPPAVRSIRDAFPAGGSPVRGTAVPNPRSCQTTRPDWTSDLRVPTADVEGVVPARSSSPSTS